MARQINTTYYDENGDMLYFLTQWDYNRQITIKIDEKITSATPEVHFFNKMSDKAIISNAVIFDSANNKVTVPVPNSLLQQPYAVYVYVYFTLSGQTKRTETFARIPIRKKPQPQDYNYGDSVEIVYLEQKLSQYRELVTKLESLNANTLITNASNIVRDYENMIATPNETVDYLQIVISDDTSVSDNYYIVDNSVAPNGFRLNSDGYYESTNKGRNNSYALCKVRFKTTTGKMYVDCINVGENNYDFGILSSLDSTLLGSYSVDTENVKKTFKGLSSSSVNTVTYDGLDRVEHYIYIKFRKDSSNSTGRDSLRFMIRFE